MAILSSTVVNGTLEIMGEIMVGGQKVALINDSN